MEQRNRLKVSRQKVVATSQPPHLARRAGLEAEVLARLAAYDGPKVSDEERAEGLLFDSG
jgi:hypothetical protein